MAFNLLELLRSGVKTVITGPTCARPFLCLWHRVGGAGYPAAYPARALFRIWGRKADESLFDSVPHEAEIEANGNWTASTAPRTPLDPT